MPPSARPEAYGGLIHRLIGAESTANTVANLPASFRGQYLKAVAPFYRQAKVVHPVDYWGKFNKMHQPLFNEYNGAMGTIEEGAASPEESLPLGEVCATTTSD